MAESQGDKGVPAAGRGRREGEGPPGGERRRDIAHTRNGHTEAEHSGGRTGAPIGSGGSAAERCAAAALALGTLLFGVGSLLHPPTARRGDIMHVVREGATAMWVADHWLLALASTLVAIGLGGFHAAVAARSGAKRGQGRLTRPLAASLAAPLGTVSATFWIGLFVFEATGWPPIAAALVKEQAPAASPIYPIAEGLWFTTLAAGYAGGVLLAAAIGFWSAALAGLRTFAWVGLTASGIGIAAQVLAWVIQPFALYLLVPAALAIGLWLFFAAHMLWRGKVS